MVLREISDLRLMAPLHGAAVDVALRVVPGKVLDIGSVREQRFDQRGFPLAVSADQADFFSAPNRRRETA